MAEILTSMVAGGAAGMSVDIGLFPIDTIKTRMQSSKGFLVSGGFKGVYKGLGPVVVGSAPGSAMFFVAYDSVKKLPQFEGVPAELRHISAAVCGEIFACIARVPTENLKQRMQVGHYSSMRAVVASVVSSEGVLGLWRGYPTMVLREIPFSVIQFPLYEKFKSTWSARVQRDCNPFEGAVAGAMAGGLAASITTPLDVAKTRIMLRESDKLNKQYTTTLQTLRSVLTHEGARALFAGVVPRTIWITVGGFIYFGAYEQTVYLMT